MIVRTFTSLQHVKQIFSHFKNVITSNWYINSYCSLFGNILLKQDCTK